MFGEEILVAPILECGRTIRSVYLPEGHWHRFDDGTVLEGGKLHQVRFELGDIPAFVRDGAVLPLADPVQSTAELRKVGVTFQCFGDQGIGHYYQDDGFSYNYLRGAYNEWRIRVDKGEFRAQPVELGYDAPKRQYRLLHKGITSPVKLGG